MHDAEIVGLFEDLFTKEGYCHLNHGPDVHEKVQAVDYLIVPLGQASENGIVESDSEIVIPVCEQCLDGLNDSDWLIVLCLNCVSSQWIYKKKAKLSYINKKLGLPYRGIIINGCPKCINQMKNIWYIL